MRGTLYSALRLLLCLVAPRTLEHSIAPHLTPHLGLPQYIAFYSTADPASEEVFPQLSQNNLWETSADPSLHGMWPPFGRQHSDSTWEVVDSKSIEPVSVYDDLDELPILRVASQDITVSCTYDVRPLLPDDKARSPISAALLNARGRLLREAARAEYNIFLVEGWSVTLHRKTRPSPAQAESPHSAPYRLSVHYTGRPAFMRGAHPGTRPPPPFFSMLQDWGVQLERECLSAPHDDYYNDLKTGGRMVSRSASKKSRASRTSRVSPPLRSPSPRDMKRRVSMSPIGGVRGWRKGIPNVLRLIHLCR
ncbi:hypothetical protein C8Q72DRAFT_885197 [Fomitopsis betulina]|nr:hypothetical protein C8Q72DRAFT_885197 [Fomitopsis betulina]